MVDYKEQSFEVGVDRIPVTFEAERPAVWQGVEQASGLRKSV